MRDRHSVSVAFLFRVGSRFEAAEVAGISHFFEHMAFKGSRDYPSARDVAQTIEGVGGVLDAGTDKESTEFWARVSHDKLPLAIDLIADIVQHPVLDAEETEKERGVIIDELRMYADNPTDHVFTTFEALMWPAHPLGVEVAGTEQSVSAISRELLAEHLETYYRAENLLVVVTGNMEHEQARELLGPWLEGWRPGPGPGFLAAPADPAESALRLIGRSGEQAHMVLGVRAVSYFDPDWVAVDLMNDILGGGMSSRLFLEVRERLGLCYDIHSWVSRAADCGASGVYLGSDPRRAEAALAAAVEQVARMCREAVPEDELARAKEHTIGRLLLALESTNAVANFYGVAALTTGKVESVEERIAQVEAVTAADIMRVAEKTYGTQPLQMAVVGPLEGEGALLDILHWN
jgi:predicted Zn-dependent peptidase